MNTMGSALRDAERIKGRLANEIVNIDFDRITSSLSCQTPQTLSGEVIVIEHALEQAKSAMSCSSPDTSELHSQEEVFHVQAQNTTLTEEAKHASDEQTQIDPGEQDGDGPTARKEGAGVADLLDLSEPIVTPQVDSGSVPQAVATQDGTADLLDLSSAPVHEAPNSLTPEANAAADAGQHGSEELLDISSLPTEQAPAIVNPEANMGTNRGNIDLLDMTSLPIEQAPASVTLEANVDTNPGSHDLFEIAGRPIEQAPAIVTPEANASMGKASSFSIPLLEPPPSSSAAMASSGVNSVPAPAAEDVQYQTKDLLGSTNVPADNAASNDLEDFMALMRVQPSTSPST